MKKRRARPQYRQGIYKPRFPEKNINKESIEYRSQLELEYFWRIEKSPNVIKWGSEVIWIPYFNPIKKRHAQYWTDLYVETKNHGTLIVEIKPEKEIIAIAENKQPKNTKRKKKATYIYEMSMFMINKAKWKAANEYCNKKSWNFTTVSEKMLKENRVFFL